MRNLCSFLLPVFWLIFLYSLGTFRYFCNTILYLTVVTLGIMLGDHDRHDGIGVPGCDHLLDPDCRPS
jgi:hypothetical protein